MSMEWWRSWHGAPMDNKWLVIAQRANSKPGVVSAVYWALLDYASQNDERGNVNGFDTEIYAAFSGFEEDEVKSIIKALEDKGVIVDNKIAQWEKRQPKREDDSNPRVRKYREMKRIVTQCNPQDKDVDSDTDKDTDKDDEQQAPPPPPSEDIPDKFDQVQAWLSKNTGLPATGKDDVDTITELAKLEIIEADIKDAIGWLNGTAGKTARRYSSLLNPIKTSYAKRIQTANGNGNGGRKLDAFEAPPIPEDRIRYVDGKKEVLEKRYKTWAEYDAHLAKWRAELAEGDRIREAELKAEAEAKNERM